MAATNKFSNYATSGSSRYISNLFIDLKLALNAQQGFLIRSFCAPEEEYHCLRSGLEEEDTSLKELLTQWEKKYEELWGKQEMVYNVHLWVRWKGDAAIVQYLRIGRISGKFLLFNMFAFQTHAEEFRKHGALPIRSAFPFEGLYSEFKKKYCDGTYNKPKQV